MNRARLLSLFGAATLLGQACGTPAARPPTAAPPQPTWQSDPALAPLRQQFGAPNQNVVLNPRAFKVSDTPSAGDVEQILPDQLVIGAQHAAWLLARTPGDVLYCGAACGGKGFLRRIVAIHQTGNQVVVDTKAAGLTDIVISGWIHGEWALPNPMTAGNPPGGLSATPLPLPGTGTAGAPSESPQPRAGESGEKTEEKDEPWEGGGEIGPDVSINGQVSFHNKLTFDLAVTPVPVTTIIPDPTCTPCWRCFACDAQWAKARTEQGALIALFPTLLGDAPELTYFRFETSPEIEVDASLTIGVYAAATYSKELWKSPDITLLPLTIGPIEIMVDLAIAVDAQAALEGEISVNGTLSNIYSANLGVLYTPATGWQGIANGNREHKANLTANGEAAAKAGLEFEPEMTDSIYGVVGPTWGFTGGVGAQVKFEIEKVLAGSGAGECADKVLDVGYYVEYGVQAGFQVKLFPFYTIWDKEVDDELWSTTLEYNLYEKNLGPEPGSCAGTSGGSTSGGTTSGGTTSGGSTTGGSTGGTGGTGTGGGNDGGLNTACSSSSDCASGFGKCAVCIQTAQICGGLGGPNFCSTNASDTVGMTCSSASDCDPCGTSGMKCADCSALGCSGGMCCQF